MPERPPLTKRPIFRGNEPSKRSGARLSREVREVKRRRKRNITGLKFAGKIRSFDHLKTIRETASYAQSRIFIPTFFPDQRYKRKVKQLFGLQFFAVFADEVHRLFAEIANGNDHSAASC